MRMIECSYAFFYDCFTMYGSYLTFFDSSNILRNTQSWL